MTIQEREDCIRTIFEEELLPLMRRKGHDYAGDKDAFSNFQDFGIPGVMVRIGDKYHRLKNFLLNGQFQVKDESVEDTLKDLINYSFFALIMKRLEKACSIQ